MTRKFPTAHRLLSILASATLALFCVAPAGAQPPSMGTSIDPSELPEPVALTDSDMKGLLKVGKELRELGVSFENGPSSPSMRDQLAGQEKAMAILNSANFTPERLQQVAYSVGLAMAAMDADFEQARAQLAEMKKMKDSMPAEQWAQMQQMMGPSMKMMEQAANQPPANIELVRKYESQLRSLGDG